MAYRPVLKSVVAIIFGMLLLLPGGCVLVVFHNYGWPRRGWPPGAEVKVEVIYFFWAFCIAISAVGVYVLAKTFSKAFHRT